MQITSTMIKRPVFTTVINLLVLLIGVMAFERLSIREYPNIDEPIITVDAKYPGASAEIMESRVTQIIEDSVSGIEGIEVMSSISRSESSQITVRFRIDRDVDDAANDVRDRVARVQGVLPEEVEDISIAKVEADAQPILYLAFSSDQHSPLEVTDVADRYVKDKLQNLNGVSGVRIFGERRFAMRIWLDRLKLAAYNLTPQDVLQALRNQNVELPAGRIESIKREFTVQATTDLRTAEEFDNLIIKQGPNYLVRLRDIGSAQIDAENTRVNARFNGKPAVAMGVIKQSTANPLQVSKEVKEAIPDIVKALPPGMNVQVAYDSSIFIDRSIKEVFKTIFEAVALVAVV
ncbi:MAG: efflux RND transporter permease subunit, partial [Alphaproteobacteria bacterium]